MRHLIVKQKCHIPVLKIAMPSFKKFKEHVENSIPGTTGFLLAFDFLSAKL